MKKTRAISLLLSLSLICAMLVPGAAAFAENESPSGSGMVINKTATANTDGSYTIQLEAYATGSKIISEVTEDVPTDIVLVLDQSGSMADCLVCGQEMNQGFWGSDEHNIYAEATSIDTGSSYYIKKGNTYTLVRYCNGTHNILGVSTKCDGGAGWYTSYWSNDHTDANKITPKTDANPNGTQFYEYKSEACSSRLSALKTTLTNFAAAVNQKAAGTDGILGTADDVNHRIAVVGYASRADSNDPWINTELFIGANQHNYNKDAKNYYNQALQNMNTPQGQSNIQDSIGALGADGATYTDYGMEMANGILDAYPLTNNEQRNRVIILFTDGFPGRNTDNFNTTAANTAISHANNAKGNGTTVYTVGIFPGADATSAGNQNGDETEKANWFMQKVSSNNGTPRTPSYYLSAGDAGSLNSIFQQISNQIETGGSSTTLDANAEIRDVVSNAFTMPENTTDINLYTAESNGSTDSWKSRVSFINGTTSINESERTISVSGFSFKDNWCGNEKTNGQTTFHDGKKLIIEFTVKPEAGFLGGNNVVTNGENSGVYDKEGNKVEAFPQPQVNVPIQDVTVTAADKNVYLLSGLTADELKSGATVKVGGVALDLSKASDTTKPWGLDPWQTEYVDIKVEVKDAKGNVISDKLENLTEDTTYTVEVTVAPKTEGTSTPEKGDAATAKTGTSEKNIYAFKPELTFKDSTAYYGETVPTNNDFGGNKVSEVWKHDTTESTTVTMLGDKPALDITYTPDNSKIFDGKYGKADVPVKADVKIGGVDVNDYTTFEHQACDPACGWETPTKPGDPAFLIHIQTCTLTVSKTRGTDNESYVFDVFKDGEKYSEVTVWGNGTETLVELPIGTYTISENAGWSWRYTANNGSSAELTAQNPTGSIACTNTKNNNQWLNGFSEVVRNIFVTNH